MASADIQASEPAPAKLMPFPLRLRPDVREAAKMLVGLNFYDCDSKDWPDLRSINSALQYLMLKGVGATASVLRAELADYQRRLDAMTEISRYLLDHPETNAVKSDNFAVGSAAWESLSSRVGGYWEARDAIAADYEWNRQRVVALKPVVDWLTAIAGNLPVSDDGETE